MDWGRLLYNGNGVNVILNVYTTWIEFFQCVQLSFNR